MESAAYMSAAQRKALFALAHECGMTTGDLHEIVYNMTGEASLKTVGRRECGRVIEELRRRAGKPITEYTSAQPLNRLSEKQEKAIRALERELGWYGNPKRMRGWLEKYYKVSAIRFLTPGDASKCIVALRKLKSAQREEKCR